jgi:hypothetical protein
MYAQSLTSYRLERRHVKATTSHAKLDKNLLMEPDLSPIRSGQSQVQERILGCQLHKDRVKACAILGWNKTMVVPYHRSSIRS